MAKQTKGEEGAEGTEATPFDLAAMLAEFGASGVTVVLYRRPSTMAEEEYLGSFPSDGFDLDSVKDMYGGGKFRFQLREAGSKKFIANTSRRFTIGGAAKYPTDGGPAAVPARALGGIDPLLDELRRITERLDRVERAPVAPAKDPLEMALSIVREMKSATGAGERTPAQEIAAAMREGMGLMREITVAQQPAEPGPYDKVAETFGPSFGKLVDAIIAERQAKMLPPAPPRATESADPSAIVPVAHPPRMEAPPVNGGGLMALQHFIPKLTRWSANNSDPMARAVIVLEEIDEKTKREILDAITDPTTVERLVAFLPGNDDQRAWYREFFDEVKREITEELAGPKLVEEDDDGAGA